MDRKCSKKKTSDLSSTGHTTPKNHINIVIITSQWEVLIVILGNIPDCPARQTGKWIEYQICSKM